MTSSVLVENFFNIDCLFNRSIRRHEIIWYIIGIVIETYKMEQTANIVCPVCTLYLRPGITLESHLSSHPKQKVIEALIKISQLSPQAFEKLLTGSTEPTSFAALPSSSTPTWTQPTPLNVTQMSPNINQVPTNHSFIYQQFMSSSGTQPLLNVNPTISQLVAVPTVINPQMFCSPYVFQQQQQLQIVSSNPNLPQIIPRPSINLLNNEISITATPNVPTNEAATSPVSPKQVHTSTSTDNDIVESEKQVQIEESEEKIEEPNKDESVQVYPLYPEVIMTEEYEVQQPQTPEITILIEKNCETIDNAEQTEIANEIEIVEEPLEITKVDNEITITLENNEDIPIIIPEKLDESWKEKDDVSTQTQVTVQFDEDSNKNEELMMDDQNTQEVFTVTTISSESDDTVKSVYTISKIDNSNVPSSSSNIQENSNVTLLEIDEDVNFMISNDFIETGKTVLSKVEDYECIKEANNDSNKIIMNIGEEKSEKKVFKVNVIDDNIFNGSLNMHADERMPPRGELSEQESNGASDIHSWGRVYQEQECSSGKFVFGEKNT